MKGEKMRQTRNMLQLFARSLPEDCLFNIISFGNRYECMFEKSVTYNQESLTEFTSKVNIFLFFLFY